MTRTLTRRLAMLLALVLLVCSFSFTALADDRPTLSILIKQDSLVSDFDDNDFTRKVEELCNVDLVFQYLPEADADTKLNLMIFSGEKLPDVICYSCDLSQTYDYAMAGAIIPITDLMADNAPNMTAIMEKYPEAMLEKKLTAADGNIYAIPNVFYATEDTIWQNCWINQGWLDQLGLEKPTTIEELYDVLVAFRDRDPNGNGKQDEIPMTGAVSGWSKNIISFLMNSFVYWNANDHINVKDGKVYAAFATEEFKEGVLYIRKLFEEGLLDAQCMTQTSDQQMALVQGEEDIVGCWMNMSPRKPETYTYLAPLTGPDRIGYTAYAQPTVLGHWFVTADCADPALAVRVGDAMFQDDLAWNLDLRYGSEGEYWFRIDENTEGYRPNYSDTVTFAQVPDTNAWNNQQNEHWRRNNPCFYWKWDDGNGLKEYVEGDDYEFYLQRVRQAEAVRYMTENHLPPEDCYIPFITYNEEETELYNEIHTDLYTYVDEMFAAYITGTNDIEAEWDSYLAELEHLRLSEFEAVVQSAYDRLYK